MRVDKDYWLFTRPIAHRGLWTENFIENSLPAYKNAIDHGYPIEIDIYSSKDGVLFSFHDASLKRMTGVDGFIYEKTANELKNLSLSSSDCKIPTFDEVLSLIDGKVPLLIEFKDQPNKSFVNKAVERLKNYNGAFAVQSFNPLIINKIKKLAPKFIRGILATNSHLHKKSVFKRYVLKNMPLNFLIKPDFISYSYEDLPLNKRIKKNLPVITWTVKNQETADRIKPYANNIIFENFIPL